MLSTGASNALLKTLEEPPAHVVFVLATTDPQKVLDTIRSRTQHFSSTCCRQKCSPSTSSNREGRRASTFRSAALDYVLRVGGGSARDTLSALDQVVAAGSIPTTDRRSKISSTRSPTATRHARSRASPKRSPPARGPRPHRTPHRVAARRVPRRDGTRCRRAVRERRGRAQLTKPHGSALRRPCAHSRCSAPRSSRCDTRPTRQRVARRRDRANREPGARRQPRGPPRATRTARARPNGRVLRRWPHPRHPHRPSHRHGIERSAAALGTATPRTAAAAPAPSTIEEAEAPRTRRPQPRPDRCRRVTSSRSRGPTRCCRS